MARPPTLSVPLGMGEIKSGLCFQTSAPTVVRDLIMFGGWGVDNVETGEPDGKGSNTLP